MGKRILRVYLAKNDAPYSAAYAKLDLPASPWELWDAMEKVRLQTDDILYMEIEDYFAFEYLSPHLDGLDISLNELNALAAQLAALDEVQGIAFEGMFSIAVQRKVNANGGIITLRDLRDLAVSAKTDCYHVVDAADDTQLGRFYAENEFVPELDGISDEVFEMLDFAGIGRMMRCSENGVFVGSLYVLQDGELTTAPPVQKTLPEKPGYLFRLTLGLHPDIGDAHTVTLDLPAAEAELLDAQEQLGVEGWEGVTVIDYDGIIPYAAEFTELPMELEELNAFTKAARDISRSEVPKLKALLEQFEVQDIETAMLLTEHLADYILMPNLSSPQEAALDQLCFIMNREEAVRLIPYVNLFNYWRCCGSSRSSGRCTSAWTMTLPVMPPVSVWLRFWKNTISMQFDSYRSKRTGTMISRQNRKTTWKGASYAKPSADNVGHDQKLQHRNIGRGRAGDVRCHRWTLYAVLPLYSQRHQVPHRG